jgi:diguanylate cyclase (GGDEF)-like protein/PAS domain S-box-containing protein
LAWRKQAGAKPIDCGVHPILGLVEQRGFMNTGAAKQLGVSLVLASAMLILAILPVLFTRFDGGVAIIWPASSLALAFLADREPRLWPFPILMSGLAMLIEVVCFGLGWRAAPLLAPALIIEPLIAAALLRPVLRVGIDTQSIRGMVGLIGVAGLIAPGLSGIPAALGVTKATGIPFQTNLLHWIAAHCLGAIIFTPVFATLVSSGWRFHVARLTGRMAAGGLLLLSSVGGTAWLVFSQSTMPLLFLPLLPMAYATLHGGRAGATLGVLVLAVVGAIHTAQGHGPVYMMHTSTGNRWLFFQAYVACTALLVLPIAALLAERAKMTECWRESEARYRAIAESLGDAVTDVGPDGIIRYASPAISEIAGVDADALVGTPARELIFEQDVERVIVAYIAANDQPGTASVVQYRGPVDADGNQRWYEASMRALQRNGSLDGVLSSVRDVTARKEAELTLTREANLDPLTGLLNRRSFMRDLKLRCCRVAAGQGAGCLALLDLDHFKTINDRYGHAVGDAVLKGVADAMSNLVRGEDRVARIGGEEFALLFWGAEADAAMRAADRLRAALGQLTFSSDQGQFNVTASLGLTRLEAELPPDRALQAADEALYRAKAYRRDQAQFAV